jgi:tripartite-type tricarboxylate transporter receptor subunit TctC
MRTGLRGSLLRSGFAAVLVFLHISVLAQFPEQPVRWIVPYPAGGGSDAIARVLADEMRQTLGQPVIVENRPRAATHIAVAALLRSKADGYTVMQAEAALIYNEHLFKKLPFDPDADFSYIGAIGRAPLVLVVDPSIAVRTVGELLDYAKANPASAHYAAPGIGTPHHLAMELVKVRSGLAMTLVPYQGGAPALQAVMSGQVMATMLDLGSGGSAIRAGKVRALAVAWQERVPALPEVPTFTELGLKEVNAYAFPGLVGPAGMHDDVVKLVNAALNHALQQPKVAAKLAEMGLQPLPVAPAEFRTLVRRESARWGPVIRTLDLRLD